MTTRKRNEFLDPISDEDEGSEAGYDSEAAEETKGRGMKRRRTEPKRGFLDASGDEDEERESDPGVSDDEDEKISRARKGKGKTKRKTDDDDEDQDDDDEYGEQRESEGDAKYLDATTTITKAEKPLKPKPLDKSKPPKKNKTGVIYFSSLPPYLRPFALKGLLEKYGFSPITRVFLNPSIPSASAPRRRSNKRKTYSDGWVEFASKKTAKLCAETLNANIVGGKKGGWYHDDVWNMKYLRGFKWADLMEQVQRERSEREAKRRVEDARAKKEEKVFVEGVEKGRVLDGMARKSEEKKRRMPEVDVPEEKVQERGNVDEGGKKGNVRRLFKQNEVKTPRDRIEKDDGAAALGEDTKRVLGKIF
ncbi:RNA-binding ATPase activator ESF2 [Aspergillus ruber CBS 135680]|uniref:Pre-rRNA-processing protein ESF2 n=1 Tax=Aspergillus ruber (strain CBS 135680) TaxID=1388766 RepID=A0A017SHV9_ASPRC|nr:uncharacterized protein EURHEDRAFT_411026 [Aspergillus ruber CBS 135680]EYE96518.1 hypothetical protein EURHEDRAFT_411026 [Aspergillus ruber CBS 135680]